MDLQTGTTQVLPMKLFRWEHGRLGQGYSKLTLLYSTALNIDAYILVVPTCGVVPHHRDPVPNGFEHHRVNITLRKPKRGGITYIEAGNPGCYEAGQGRMYRFRPDTRTHFVTAILKGQLWLLSFGWLRKVKAQ